MKTTHKYAQDYESNLIGAMGKISWIPTIKFYFNVVKVVADASIAAYKNEYTNERWVYDSYLIGEAVEKVGGRIQIEGVKNLNFDEPCVFMANHMSTLETFFLPCMVQPKKDVTFVVKDTLLRYPGVGAVFRARNPIGVTRDNPKVDLAKVMNEGVKILEGGRSIIIFPQGRRFTKVEPESFSSLAVKLAKKANVPILPIALKTDFWGIGKRVKEIGIIKPKIPVRVRFGKAMSITGNGKEENAQCIDFIMKSLEDFKS